MSPTYCVRDWNLGLRRNYTHGPEIREHISNQGRTTLNLQPSHYPQRRSSSQYISLRQINNFTWSYGHNSSSFHVRRK